MDMKPSNVLLDSDMNPKIIDFGISEVLNDNEITHDSMHNIWSVESIYYTRIQAQNKYTRINTVEQVNEVFDTYTGI